MIAIPGPEFLNDCSIGPFWNSPHCLSGIISGIGQRNIIQAKNNSTQFVAKIISCKENWSLKGNVTRFLTPFVGQTSQPVPHINWQNRQRIFCFREDIFDYVDRCPHCHFLLQENHIGVVIDSVDTCWHKI